VLRDQRIVGAAAQLPPIEPRALPAVKLNGRLPAESLGNLAGATVEIRHYAAWILDSYGVWDGVVPQFQIGTVPLARDGTFSVDLPDLAQDPFVSKSKSRGWFRLTATIRNTVYQLEPAATYLNKSSTLDDQGLVVPRDSVELSVTFTVRPNR
jgi:hypothetical protein